MIRWTAEHKVAANLLMVIILVAGVMGVSNIKQEVFPEFDLDQYCCRLKMRFPE